MSIKMLAVAVVAALVACVSGVPFTSDGSSAAKNCIVNAGNPFPVTYLAGGTDAGQEFITARSGPVAFGDYAFGKGPSCATVKKLPAYVKQFPVARGSIVVYRNTAKAVAFTTQQLCNLFSGKDNTYTTIARSDCSGSTNVFVNYLKMKCKGFVLKADKLCEGTSGVIACLKSTPNSITYASCGQSAVEASVDGLFCKVAKTKYPIKSVLWAYTYNGDPAFASGRSLTERIKTGACIPYFYYPL